MKNKNILIIVIVVLIIVNIFLLIKYSRLMFIQQQFVMVEAIRVENTLLKEGFFHTYDFESVSMDFDDYLQNYNQETFTFRNLVSGKPTLVLFMNFSGCSKCFNENIKKVKEGFNNKSVNVLIGIEGLDYRSFRTLVINNNIEEYSYMLPPDFFDGFYLNPVVFFVIEESLEPVYFYAPSQTFPDLTDVYITKILELVK